MARAGYDPNAAISLWQKMSQKPVAPVPHFSVRTPTSSSRISDLQADIPKVLPLYRAAAKALNPLKIRAKLHTYCAARSSLAYI
jgi:predicted Zn-dependent protease